MQAELEKLRYAVSIPLAKEFLLEDVKFVADEITGMIILQVHGYVWAQSLCDYKHPENWKEALKERWFPKWLLKRFPVKYAVLDIKEIYPDYRIAPEVLGERRIIVT